MAHAGAIENPVLALLPDNVDGLKIFDCAFGHGFWGHRIRVFKKGIPSFQGIDIGEPHVSLQKSLGIYDHVRVWNVATPPLPYPDRYFDISIVCEIIEHLTYIEGMTLIPEVERITKNRVIVSAPLGFMKQDPLYGNEHERHISTWYPTDLHSLGYKVSIHDDRLMTRLPLFVDNIRRRFFGFPLPLLMVGYKDLYDPLEKTAND